MMLAHLAISGLILQAPADIQILPVVLINPYDTAYLLPCCESVTVPTTYMPAHLVWGWRDGVTPDWEFDWGGPTDVNLDGDSGTDADIEAFFALYTEGSIGADWNADGVVNSDDIGAFFGSL